MRIVIISGVSPPEPVTASRINWDVASRLAEENNQVWLISPKPSRLKSSDYKETTGTSIRKVGDNFYHIWLDSFTCPKYSLFLRAYESLDFGLKSISYVNRKIENVDLIYICSWPVICPLMIIKLRKNKQVPVIVNIQDLYPESLLARINSKAIAPVFYPLFFLDRLVANGSTHITVISESFRKRYINKIKDCESKISVIHNWQDPEVFIKISATRDTIIRKYNLLDCRGKFIFMFLGNVGPVAGVEKLIFSFLPLDRGELYLIIAGTGTEKEKCQLLSERLGLSNIAFVDVPPEPDSVAELQSILDIMLLPINPESAHSSIPSKLIAYMFSAKPVITSASDGSEPAKAIKESGCGWISGTDKPEEWARVMESAFNTDLSVRLEMGKAGFRYAMNNYSRTEGLRKISKLINDLAVK
jgi:glycosyltransferase involved in cell wall biosynthesis